MYNPGVRTGIHCWSNGPDLAPHLPHCGAGLGGLVHLPRQAAQGQATHITPLNQTRTLQLKKSSMKMVVISVWVTAILVGALPLFGWNRYVYEV